MPNTFAIISTVYNLFIVVVNKGIFYLPILKKLAITFYNISSYDLLVYNSISSPLTIRPLSVTRSVPQPIKLDLRYSL